MTLPSPPSVLVLHAVRLLGLADSATIAARAGIDRHHTAEILRDAQQRGWVQHNSFAGLEHEDLVATLGIDRRTEY